MATYYAKQNQTFTSKPVGNVTIDWQHPLARNIRFAYVPTVHKTGTELVSDELPTSGTIPAIGSNGYAELKDTLNFSKSKTSGDVTVFFEYQTTSYLTATTNIVSCKSVYNSADGFNIDLSFDNQTPRLVITCGNFSRTFHNIGNHLDRAKKLRYKVIVNIQGTSVSVFSSVLDYAENTQTTSTAVNGTLRPLRVGGATDPKNINYVIVTDPMTNEEALAFNRNPYAFLKPAAPQYFPLGAANDAGGVVSADITESVTLTDVQTINATLVDSASESITAADSQTSTYSTGAIQNEALTQDDVVTGVSVVAADLSESVSLDDSLSGSATGQASAAITESLTLSDSQSNTAVLSDSHRESISLDDTHNGTRLLTASASEPVNLGDTTDSFQGNQVAQLESVSLGDYIDCQVVYNDMVTETIALDDNQVGNAVYQCAVTDAISLSEISTGTVPTAQFAGVTETFTLTDYQIGFEPSPVTPTGSCRQFHFTGRPTQKYSSRPTQRYKSR